jgi:hypothetical protein
MARKLGMFLLISSLFFFFFLISNILVVLISSHYLQICIILGVVLMVLAPIGALRQIILQARDFQFYS